MTDALARALLVEQFPEHAPHDLRPLGEGWDNRAFVLNETFVVRFPRRRIAVPLLEAELDALPRLAPLLPVPIPDPVIRGVASERYPYPFAGYRMLAGETACARERTPEERAALGPALGRFLRALHDAPVPEEPDPRLLEDPFGKHDLAGVYRARAADMARRAKAHPEFPADAVRARLETLSTGPGFAGSQRWIHGDLHGRHVLVGETGDLAGVLDWGDVMLGDPGLDLSVAFTLIPPEGRHAFFEAYGEVDVATRSRARFRALAYAPSLHAYGKDRGDAGMLRMARWILEGEGLGS